jgi:hypothetical protein
VANFSASSGAFSRGYSLDWTLVFDDVANTVTIDATYTQPPDGTIPVPGTAAITFTLNTSVSIRLDLVTARLSTGQLFDGNSATMLNSGPRTRTGVRLKVSADRAAAITHSTEFVPIA